MMLIFDDLEVEGTVMRKTQKDKEVVETDEYMYKTFSINGFLKD
jgi:hypothetical protein